MIYTAARMSPGSTVPQSNAYVLRKLEGLTQGKMSQLTIAGKSMYPQLGYDGYRANIAAFLWATFHNKRVNTGFYVYPFKAPTTSIQIPFALPKIAFIMKVDPSASQKKQFLEKWASKGLQEITLSSRTKGYTLESPEPADIALLLRIAKKSMGTPEGYASLEALPHTVKLYSIVELFLRTNTYPAFRSEPTIEGVENTGARHLLTHNSKRSLLSGEDVPMKEARTLGRRRKGDMHARQETEEPEDNSLALFTDVLVAKPSPLPPSTCFGSPSSVPFLPGFCFPYFDGMIPSDPAYIRNTVLERYFSLLPEEDGADPRDAYKAFRSEVGTLAYTQQGLYLTHVLKGMELALECQAQLYLLFDKKVYLGFALLGAGFDIYDGSKWCPALSDIELRAELATLFTHDAHIDALAGLLSKFPRLSTGGPIQAVSKKDINTSVRLAKVLSTLDLEAGKDALTGIEGHLKALSMGDTFLSLTKEHLIAQIPKIFAQTPTAPPDDAPLYIPVGSLELLADLRNWHLLAFGSRVPSFYSAKGKEFVVPGPKDKDTAFPEEVVQGDTRMRSLHVTPKIPTQGAKDLKVTMAKRAVRFEPAERAAASRNVVFKEKSGKEVWEALKLSLGMMPVVVKVQKGKGGSRVDTIEEDLDFDDILAAM